MKRSLVTLPNTRRRLEAAFALDTAAPGTPANGVPSAGHCAAVAVIIQRLYGGEFKSAVVSGQSHWFNHVDGHDVDLTGDQFGFPEVQCTDRGLVLYEGARLRVPEDLKPETLERARKLAFRAGLGGAFEQRPLRVRPYTIKSALSLCKETHRRLPRLQGAMWAISVQDGDEVRGTAIVGRPTARLLDNGLRLQVLRVAVKEGTPNGCSILYAACSRAAKDMGASDCFTYIHDDESGVSLKAAGWVEDVGFVSRGGEWSTPSRPRAPTVEPGAKKRWFAPWSEMLKVKQALLSEAA